MDSRKPLTGGILDLDIDELKRIVARLEDQDNLCTRDVAFHVQQRVRLYGIDPEYTENVAWMQDGEEIDPDLWERLDEAESNGETGIGVGDDECYVLAELEHVGFVDRWETVQVFFTSEGAERYIKTNGHNLTGPRIYGESFYRNYEMMTVRKNLPHLLSMLTPPPDAAVREAVERLSAGVNGPWEGAGTMFADIRTLLRAVQATRLTDEQVEAVLKAGVLLDGLTDEYPGHRDEVDEFKAAFPEAFAGEVGRG